MESASEEQKAKDQKANIKIRQPSALLNVSECVRQFELPQTYPSTVTELRSKPGQQKASPKAQIKNVQNLMSALPLSGKMKFIPNKEVSFSSEKLQKLKFKSTDGRDLGEFELVVPGQDEKVQTKLITMSKVGQASEKPVTWQVQSSKQVGESKKPKIKHITRVIDSSFSEESKVSGEILSPKMKLQLLNGNSTATANQNSLVSTNSKRTLDEDGNEASTKILVQCTDGDVIKKLFIEKPNAKSDKQSGQPQIISLKKLSGSQKMVMFKNGTRILKPLSDKSFKTATQRLINYSAQDNMEKFTVKCSVNGSILRKRDDPNEQWTEHEIKKLCLRNDLDSMRPSGKSSEYVQDNMEKDQAINTATQNSSRKNIMVIVPNETAEESTSSSRFNEGDKNENTGKSFDSSFDDDTSVAVSKNNVDRFHKVIDEGFEDREIHLQDIDELNDPTKTMNKKSSDTQNHSLSILQKALLSVQDTALREEALKALRTCGLAVKRKVPIRRQVPTKIIHESAVQTDVFSLLKDNEFIQVTEESENLENIKLSQKLMKQPIARSVDSTHSILNQNIFKSDLDCVVEKIFPENKQNILNVEEALLEDRKTRTKNLLDQLLRDFNSAKNFDEDGFLNIHRAVTDDDIMEVQKQMIMLKITKQSIDVCSQDDKTSLELAVEYKVNPKIIQLLLDNGAQPVSSKPIHDSALIIAAKSSLTILPLLMKYINANNRSLLNSTGSEGLAPIHYCAQNGNLKGIEELLKAGADVNLQDDRTGKTALFYAVDTRNSDIPQERFNDIAFKLLEKEAFSNIPTFSKHSVLSLIDDVKSHALKIALNRAIK